MNKLKYTLRMEKQLLQKLQRIAKEENRSVNREFAYIIRRTVHHFEEKYGRLSQNILINYEKARAEKI